MAVNNSVTPNTLLFDPQTGKLTREGFQLIQKITRDINAATSTYILVDAIQTLTNKTMDGDANTFLDIATSALKTKTGTGGRVVTATAAGTAGIPIAFDAVGNVAPISLVTVDNTIARFNGLTGIVQGSGVVISDTDNMSAMSLSPLAGTATVAPLLLTSGTNLTAAAAGAWEYDGKTFYSTTVAASRGVSPSVQFTVLAADFNGTDVNTAQPVFDTAQDVITLAASTTYEFEAEYWITRAAGTTSHTTAVLFGGTATFTSVGYLAQVTNPTGNVLANVQHIWGEAATALVLTAANTSATEHLLIKIKGRIRTNAAGTLIPQFQYSAAPGGVPTIKRNSAFRIWPLGVDTVTAVGNWA